MSSIQLPVVISETSRQATGGLNEAQRTVKGFAKATMILRHKAMVGIWIAEKTGGEDIHILGRRRERHESSPDGFRLPF